MPKRPYKILFVARDNGGCGFYRCKQPADFLKRSGLADAEYVLTNPTKEQLFAADLVVMQEMGSMNSSNLMRFMQENKIPYIAEFDDFIFHVSPNNVAGHQAWNPSTLYLHRSLQLAKQSVGITVSTKMLAKEFFPYNPYIYVIQNFLDKEKWDQPVSRRSDGKTRIGWCGGNAHADDLHMISKVLNKVVKEYEGKVVFETMGMTRHELSGVFPMDPTSADSCPSCGFEGTLHHHPGETLDDYPVVLAGKAWDFALAPVIDNAFGNAKSDLKIKEYAAMGLPIIASRVKPYIEAAESGAHIIFADTFEEWYTAIKDLVENVAQRDAIARSNKAWIQNFWIQDNIGSIFEVYKQVIDQVRPILGITEDRLTLKN